MYLDFNQLRQKGFSVKQDKMEKGVEITPNLEYDDDVREALQLIFDKNHLDNTAYREVVGEKLFDQIAAHRLLEIMTES